MSALNWERHSQEVSLLLRVVLGIAAWALPAAVIAAPPVEIATALEQLDADSYADRERASHALWQAAIA